MFDNGTAYIAVKKMLLGDMSPYIFRTHDFGKTWTKIVSGIAPNDYTHAVREDPVRQGLLYAGTQHGFYISFDDGNRWQPFKQGLPDTPVADIWVEGNDMAITAHGRGFYVLDNLATLRQLGTTSTSDAQLFRPAETIRGVEGAGIDYFLKAQPKTLTLDILDGQARVVRSFTGAPPKPRQTTSTDGQTAGGSQQAPAAGSGQQPSTTPDRTAATVAQRPAGGAAQDYEPPSDEGPRGPATTVPMANGLNRFTWDLTTQPIVSFPGMVLWGATQNGPMVLPGMYQVRLTVDGQSQTQPLVVKKHPLRNTSDADLMAQYELASRIRDKVNEANTAVIRIRRMKTDIVDRTAKDSDGDLKQVADRLTRNLTSVEEEIYQVRNRSNQDPLNFAIKINNRLASLLRVVNTGEGRPTSNAEPIFNDIVAELKAQTDRLQQVIATDLPTLNRMLQRVKKQPVSDQ
jgi:hypothetical protein